ncbi:MAG: DUF421 domain-containing protein [Chloroflexota bacterium]|nr:DUF421 domain-containing protein [Chloroflexota bacterium]
MEHTIDLQKMFLGDGSPVFTLEIILRTTIMYLYTLFLMRLLGQRSLAQLSIGEFALIVALGASVGDPMIYDDTPLLHGMLVITVVVFIQLVLTGLAQRSRRAERALDGTPICLVRDGELDAEGIHRARMTHNEVFAELRQSGIEDMGEVRRAYLEQDGEMSVFKFDQDDMRPMKSILPNET